MLHDRAITAWSAKASIQLVTNMYPYSADPRLGVFVKATVDALRRNGHHVSITTINRRLPKVAGYLIFWLKSFVVALRSKTQIIYVHFASLASPGVLLACMMRPRLCSRLIINAHGGDLFPDEGVYLLNSISKKALGRLALKVAAVIVVPSEPFAARVRNAYSPRAPIMVYPSGGVRGDVFISTGRVERKYALFCGRIIPGKGAIEAAAAFAVLEPVFRYHGLSCLFVGEGSELDTIKRNYSLQFSSGYFESTGFKTQEALAEIFRQSLLLVFPSHRPGESLGLTPIEAGFCGTHLFVYGLHNAENLVDPRYHKFFRFDSSGQLVEKLSSFIQLDNQTKYCIREETVKWLNARYEIAACDKKLEAIINFIQQATTPI